MPKVRSLVALLFVLSVGLVKAGVHAGPGPLAVDASGASLQVGFETLHALRIDRSALRASRVSAVVGLPSTGSVPVMARVQRVQRRSDGQWVWIGEVDTDLGKQSAVIVMGDDAVFGVIPQKSGPPLRIASAKGRDWLVEGHSVEPAQSGSGDDFLIAPTSGLKSGKSPAVRRSATSATGVPVIDVLVLYNTSMLTQFGSESTVLTRVAYLETITNQAYVSSAANLQIRVVGVHWIDYATNNDNSAALSEITTASTLPAKLEIDELRAAYNADLVSLVRAFDANTQTTGGIAWLNGYHGDGSGFSGNYGFSVVSDCAPGSGYYCSGFAFSHELGHNMGSHHDSDTAGGDYGAFIYSRGYRTSAAPANFYTIMAYRSGSQVPVARFSNPGISDCQGLPCGIVDAADNARSLGSTAPTVEGFRSGPITANLRVADVSVLEGQSGTSIATFTVKLAPASAAPVSFTLASADGTATAGSDYVALDTGLQTFAPGATTKTYTVTINGDTTIEYSETFTVSLANVSGAVVVGGSATGTIVDDDAPVLSVEDTSVAEGDSGTHPATFTVTLSKPSPLPVTFEYATDGITAQSGTDFLAIAPATQLMAPGETVKTFLVDVVGDTDPMEPDETFRFSLGKATGTFNRSAQAIGTIRNDDGPLLSVADVSVPENAGPAVFTVTMSAPSPNLVTFRVKTTDGTATSLDDYSQVSTIASIAPGQTSATFSVTIYNNNVIEPDETFSFDVTNILGGQAGDTHAVGTISNDDVRWISVDNLFVTEGNTGTSTALVKVSLSTASPTPVTFDLTTADMTANAGSDFVPLNLVGASIPAGSTSAYFAITIQTDLIPEGDELFSVVASNAVGAVVGNTGYVCIVNDDFVAVQPGLSISDATVTEGNAFEQFAIFTVTLDKPQTGLVSFDMETEPASAQVGSDFTPASEIGWTIQPGNTSATFSVMVKGDVLVEGNETFTLNLRNVVGAPIVDGIGLGKIVNDDFASMSIADATVAEGGSEGSAAIFVVTLSNPMPTPTSFTIATSNGTALAGSDFSARSQGVRVLDAGRTRAVFEVNVIGDSVAEGTEKFTVAVTNVSGAIVSRAAATGTILDDDAALTAIGMIQGTGPASPLLGQDVVTEGIVTAVVDDGFFLQSADPIGDGDSESSEGVLVLQPGSSAKTGQRLRVRGQVEEAHAGERIDGSTMTRVRAHSSTVAAESATLPAAVEIDLRRRRGGDFERFEGMRVFGTALRVVGPTGGVIDPRRLSVQGDGRFHVAAADNPRPFAGDDSISRLLVRSGAQPGSAVPSADVGDRIASMTGVLAQGDGLFELLPDAGAAIELVSAIVTRPVSAKTPGEIVIGSINLRQFDDDLRDGNEPVSDPDAYALRLAKTANMICSYARSPDILAVAEVENLSVLADLASATNGRDGNLLFPGSCGDAAGYKAMMIPSASAQGRNLGFLVRSSPGMGQPRIEVLSLSSEGPRSRFRHPDGSSVALHKRPPLLLTARLTDDVGRSIDLTVIATQSSNVNPEPETVALIGWQGAQAYVRARRTAQARDLAKLVGRRQLQFPAEKLLLLGDVNSDDFAARTGMRDLATTLPPAQRYNAVRDGLAVLVDRVWANSKLLAAAPRARIEVARLNADAGEDHFGDASVPLRVADRDPLVGYFPFD